MLRVLEAGAVVDRIPHSVEGFNWQVGGRLGRLPAGYRIGPGTFTIR